MLTRRLTPGRIGLGIVAVAFVIAEMWRPTMPYAKKDSQTGLVIGMRAGTSGFRATFDTELLDDLPRIVGVPLGNIDVVTAGIGNHAQELRSGMTVSRRATIRLVGWLADSQTRAAGFAVFAIVNGRRLAGADVWYGALRPDVAKYYASTALRKTGFTARLQAGRIGPGADRVELGLVSSDRRGFFLDPQPLTVYVRP